MIETYRVVVGDDDMIDYISLVKSPAIEKEFIAMSKHDIKLSVDGEKRIISGPVLIPDMLIPRMNEKGIINISFSKESIEKLAFNTMKNINKKDAITNIEHSGEAEISMADVYIIESWIKMSEVDKSSTSYPELPIGTWFMSMKVEDDKTWEYVKSGKVKGFSIESFLELEKISMSSDISPVDLYKQLKSIK
jgi:hypothetical protein